MNWMLIITIIVSILFYQLLRKTNKKMGKRNSIPNELPKLFMKYVEGGKFTPLGTEEEKEIFDMEVSQYLVTKKLFVEVKEYELSGHEFDLFQDIMYTEPIKRLKGENKPVEMSYNNALLFCNKLSKIYKLKPVYNLSKISEGIVIIGGLEVDIDKVDEFYFKNTEGFRLATEWEWEYFASGGKLSKRYKFPGSNDINEVAWYGKNSKGRIHDVGKKKPNELELYDCAGNLAEWIFGVISKENRWDRYVKISVNTDSIANYKAVEREKVKRITKGGTYMKDSDYCSVPSRIFYPYQQTTNAGLRIVRTIKRNTNSF